MFNQVLSCQHDLQLGGILPHLEGFVKNAYIPMLASPGEGYRFAARPGMNQGSLRHCRQTRSGLGQLLLHGRVCRATDDVSTLHRRFEIKRFVQVSLEGR